MFYHLPHRMYNQFDVQPFHRHPSPTPTSPNLAPETSNSSAATPTRTAKPDTKPNVKTKPSVSRPPSAKRTAHPKTSSSLHRPDLANSAPTPRTANTTFPHLRDQGACSKPASKLLTLNSGGLPIGRQPKELKKSRAISKI